MYIVCYKGYQRDRPINGLRLETKEKAQAYLEFRAKFMTNQAEEYYILESNELWGGPEDGFEREFLKVYVEPSKNELGDICP